MNYNDFFAYSCCLYLPFRKKECIAINHDFKNNNLRTDDSKVAGKQRSGSKTPRKSKRMAAKLDGHSSTEGDITPSNSKSVSER